MKTDRCGNLTIDQRMLAQSIERWPGPLPSASMLVKHWSPTWSIAEVERMLGILVDHRVIEVIETGDLRKFRAVAVHIS